MSSHLTPLAWSLLGPLFKDSLLRWKYSLGPLALSEQPKSLFTEVGVPQEKSQLCLSITAELPPQCVWHLTAPSLQLLSGRHPTQPHNPVPGGTLGQQHI